MYWVRTPPLAPSDTSPIPVPSPPTLATTPAPQTSAETPGVVDMPEEAHCTPSPGELSGSPTPEYDPIPPPPKPTGNKSLGTNPPVPRQYMLSTWWFHVQNTNTFLNQNMLSSFRIHWTMYLQFSSSVSCENIQEVLDHVTTMCPISKHSVFFEFPKESDQ